MKNSRRDTIQILETVFITVIAYAVNYIINLLLTPFITNALGADAYGFITLANNIVSFATIGMLSINSFAARFIAVCYHRGEMTKAKGYYSTVFVVDAAIGLVLLLVGIFFSLNISSYFNVPVQLQGDITLLFILAFLNFFILAIQTAPGAAPYVVNRLTLAQGIKGVSFIAEGAVLVAFYLLLPSHLFYVGIGLVVSSLIIALGNLWIARHYMPELQVVPQKVKWEYCRDLMSNGVWSTINSLGNQLNSGLDLIVCNLMLGALAMGQLAIVKTVVSIINGIMQMASQAFQPKLLKRYSKHDIEGLIHYLRNAMVVSGWITNLAVAGVMGLGYAYFELWVPGQDTLLIYRLAIISSISLVFEGSVYPLYYIYTLTTKNRFPCFITVFGGIVNVICEILLIAFSDLGVYSITIMTAIVMSVISLVSNPVYSAYCLKQHWITFYPTIAINVISCVMQVFVFHFLAVAMSPSSWGSFLLCAVCCCILGSFIHLALAFLVPTFTKSIKRGN